MSWSCFSFCSGFNSLGWLDRLCGFCLINDRLIGCGGFGLIWLIGCVGLAWFRYHLAVMDWIPSPAQRIPKPNQTVSTIYTNKTDNIFNSCDQNRQYIEFIWTKQAIYSIHTTKTGNIFNSYEQNRQYIEFIWIKQAVCSIHTNKTGSIFNSYEQNRQYIQFIRTNAALFETETLLTDFTHSL